LSSLVDALYVQILGRFNRARAAQLTLPHFVCQAPLFMPVGTQGNCLTVIYVLIYLQKMVEFL